MATPAAILSILVKAEGIAGFSRSLAGVQQGLVATDTHGKRAEKRLAGVGAAGTKAGAGLAHAAKSAGALVGAYAGFKGIEKSIHTTEDLGKTTLTLSKSFGLAADEASRWAAVSKARGTEGKQLTMGFKTLATQVRAASTGTTAAKKTFKDLGISMKELRGAGGDMSQVLSMVSDGLGAMPAGANKAAIQARLFGRTWLTLSPLIRDGADAMNEQLKVADEYGATLGGKNLKAIRETIKAQREAKLASLGLQVTVGTTLIPVIDKAIQGFAHWVKAFRDGTGSAGQFRAAIENVLQVLSPFGESIQQIVGFLKQHEQVAQPLIGVILGLAAAQTAWNLAMNANPVVRLITVLALLTTAVVTAYRESATFRNIVDTAFAAITTAAGRVAGAATVAFAALRGGFQSVLSLVTSVTNTVVGEVSQWDTLWSAIGRGAGIMVAVVKASLAALQTAFQAGMLVLAPIATAAWTLVKGVFTAQWTILKGLVTGGLQAIRGVIQIFGGLFKGDFSQVWDGIKTIFRGGLTAVKGVLEGAWKLLKAPVDALGDGLHDAFQHSWDRVKDVFRSAINAVIDFLDVIRRAINSIPGIPDIGPLPHLGGGGGGGNPNIPVDKKARGGAYGRTGGVVNAPITLMGEEAPRHPEFVIPTNPMYRGRAKGLLAQAAATIGMAHGGIYSQGEIMDLWMQAGGAGDRRLIASAIAMAESSGRANATSANPAGGQNLGLWQIWSGNPGATLDPLGNAKAARNLSHNGATWGLWEAFTNGNYKRFMNGKGGGGGGGGGLSVGDILGKFPNPGDLPPLVQGVGKYVVAKAGAYVKKQVGDLFTGEALSGKGLASGLSLGVQKAIKVATGMGWAYPSPGQLTGGNHVKGSLHYSGRAVDFGNAGHTPAQMMGLWHALIDRFGLGLNELFYDPAGRYIDAHRWVQGAIGGHGDHIHAGFREGGLFQALATGGQFPPGKKVYHQFWNYARTKGGHLGPITDPIGRGTSPAKWWGTLRDWFGVRENEPIYPYDKMWKPKWNRGDKYASGGVLGMAQGGQFPPGKKVYHLFWNWARKNGGHLGPITDPIGKGTSPAKWWGSLRDWFGVRENEPIYPYDKMWRPKWNHGDKYAKGGKWLGSFQHGGITSAEGLAHLHKNEAIIPLAGGGVTGGHTIGRRPIRGPKRARASHGRGFIDPYPIGAIGGGLGQISRRLGPVTATPPPEIPPIMTDLSAAVRAAMAQARLTASTADDLAALQSAQSERQAQYNAAVAAGDPELIATTADNLADVNASLEQLTGVIAEQNRIAEERKRLDEQIAANQLKILALSGQGDQILAAVVAAVNGGIGGRTGLGFQSPSYAGGMARYK